MTDDPGGWRIPTMPPIRIPVPAAARAAEKQLRAASDTVNDVANEIGAFQNSLAADEEAWFSMMGAGGGLMIRPRHL